MPDRPRIAVVGATGAVGTVTLSLLRERGYEHVRAFASARSAGRRLDGLLVEEATAEALSAGDLDLCLFSVGPRRAASSSRTRLPAAPWWSTSPRPTGLRRGFPWSCRR